MTADQSAAASPGHGQPAGKSEGLDDAGPVSCCHSPRRQARPTPPTATDEDPR